MKKTWSVSCHKDREIEEIDQIDFLPSGKFWPDLNNLVVMLDACPHPSFTAKQRTEGRYFCSSFRFDEFSFAILCKVAKTSFLKVLAFSCCDLSEGYVNFLISLTGENNLIQVNIDWNPLPDPLVFVKFFHGECKLTAVSIRACELNNECFEGICERLIKNETIKTLDLYGNLISDLAPLAEVLENNRTLHTLSLCGNRVSDNDLKQLVGTFGKIKMSQSQAEEYKKIEKEKATSKYLRGNRGGKGFTDELDVNEETGDIFLMKNKVFMNFNLSLNEFSNDHYLRLVLSQALPGFKIILSKNRLPESVKASLLQAFGSNIIV